MAGARSAQDFCGEQTPAPDGGCREPLGFWSCWAMAGEARRPIAAARMEVAMIGAANLRLAIIWRLLSSIGWSGLYRGSGVIAQVGVFKMRHRGGHRWCGLLRPFLLHHGRE